MKFELRCNVCGRFIGHNDDTKIEFTPDSEFTEEITIITHKSCN